MQDLCDIFTSLKPGLQVRVRFSPWNPHIQNKSNHIPARQIQTLPDQVPKHSQQSHNTSQNYSQTFPWGYRRGQRDKTLDIILYMYGMLRLSRQYKALQALQMAISGYKLKLEYT